MSHASAGFGADLASVGEARRFVRRALVDMGAEELEFEACQVVSELATNAVIHAATPFQVELERDGDNLEIRVSDGSEKSPVTKAHSDQATTGRGLRLVAKLATDWGTELTPGGKTVWCILTAGTAERTGKSQLRSSDVSVRDGSAAPTRRGPGSRAADFRQTRLAA